MNMNDLSRRFPAVEQLLHNADYADLKTFSGNLSLNTFIARFVGYMPLWLRALYVLRGIPAKLMGLKQPRADNPNPSPEDIEFTPGSKANFFTTVSGEPGRYWVGEASDKHLACYLAILAEPDGETTHFHVLVIVHYRHWSGPLYFTVIRPFHHLVTGCMGRHAARA